MGETMRFERSPDPLDPSALALHLSEQEAKQLLWWVCEKGAHREADGPGQSLFFGLEALLTSLAESAVT